MIFLDELDTILKQRSGKNTHGEDLKVVNEFLNHLEDTGENDIIFIGATNRAGDLDEAGTRSGRIDKEVHIGKPDKEARGKIFRAQLSDWPAELTSDEMLTLAERTNGMVAADIETTVESGAKKVLVNGEDTITYEHLVEAINGMED